MHHQTNEDRPERSAAMSWIHNPAAPLTDEEINDFTTEAARLLTDTLDTLENGKEAPTC